MLEAIGRDGQFVEFIKRRAPITLELQSAPFVCSLATFSDARAASPSNGGDSNGGGEVQ